MVIVNNTKLKGYSATFIDTSAIDKFSEKLDYNKAFVYLYRRFGVPQKGDKHKTLGDWVFKSKRTDLILDFHISYTVFVNIYCKIKSSRRIVKEYYKELEKWRNEWNAWCIKQGAWTKKDVAFTAKEIKKVVQRDKVDKKYNLAHIKSAKTLLRYFMDYMMLLEANDMQDKLEKIEKLEKGFGKIKKMPNLQELFNNEYEEDIKRMLELLEEPVSIRDIGINIYGRCDD